MSSNRLAIRRKIVGVMKLTTLVNMSSFLWHRILFYRGFCTFTLSFSCDMGPLFLRIQVHYLAQYLMDRGFRLSTLF